MEQEVEGQIQAINEGKGSSSNLKSFLSGYTILATSAHIPLRLLPCITASCKPTSQHKKRPSMSVHRRHQIDVRVKQLSSPTSS